MRVPRQVRNYIEYVQFKSVTYSSLATGSLSEFIEVDEELLYADAVFTGKSLKFAFDIVVLR